MLGKYESLWPRWACILVLAVVAGSLSGCQSDRARFLQNAAFKKKVERANMQGDDGAPTELSAGVTEDIGNILEALFGTPDAPKLPAIEGLELNKIADLKALQVAAGPVKSDQEGIAHGLYREHCVHCHGISGDGNGPTAAFLNPYPRDYRLGLYKFKSSKKGEKPTQEDLQRIVHNGIPGTAMPSFALLPEIEVNALIDYVKYLSIRGETERKLFAFATSDLVDPFDELYAQYTTLSEELTRLNAAAGPSNENLASAAKHLDQAFRKLTTIRSGAKKVVREPGGDELETVEDLPAKVDELEAQSAKLESDAAAYTPPRMFVAMIDGKLRPEAEIKGQLTPYLEMAKEAMEPWTTQASAPVPAPPTPLAPKGRDSIARGRAIFYGPIANCFSCHGDSGLGDGQRDFYDEWSGEWVEKGKPQATDIYVAAGALPPRNLVPRNLRLGIYRGGRRPVDLYWRLTNGIDGAQMPAVPLLAQDDPPGTKKLSQSQLWDLINYVRSLPYEPISRPAREESHLAKEVQ